MARILEMTMDSDDSPLITAEGEDMNGVYFDSACDNDNTPNLTDIEAAGNCTVPGKDIPGAFQMFADEGQVEISESISNRAGTTTVVDDDDDDISFSTIALVLLITGGIGVGFWTGKLPCLSKDALPKRLTHNIDAITAKFHQAKPPQPQQAGRGGSPRNPMSYADPVPDVEETNPVRSSQCRSAVKRAESTETKKDRTSMNAPPSAVSGRAMTPPRRALPALRP